MVLTLCAFMCSTTASIISDTGCGTTKIQSSLSGGNATGDKAIIGVFVSVAIWPTWVVEGAETDPMIASTLSSVTSLRAFLAATDGSEASSNMMYFTGWPPSVLGNS